MVKRSTVGEHLRTLTGIVEMGYGPYKRGERVSWPLPHPTTGPVEISAVYKDRSATDGSLDYVKEDDPIPDGIIIYIIHDNGHRRKEGTPRWPTLILFPYR